MRTWIIEERHNEYSGVEADRVRIDGGALIFENGDIFTSELVLAQAAGTWLSVHPRSDEDECTCDDKEEEQ